MLQAHMAAVEDQLLVTSRIPANSGHSLHKGTPREAFIKEFLEQHLPSSLAIGTGEIIDCNSRPGEARRQFDIVVYKRNMPRLDFGGGISGFLVESVIATIEVKSTLDKTGLSQAMTAAHSAKSLTRSETWSFHSGYIPPSTINFVVAYDGPQHLRTVVGWINDCEREASIPATPLPHDNEESRIQTPSSSIDGVVLLGKGLITFDNLPVGFVSPQMRAAHPTRRWVAANMDRGALLWLFQILTQASMNVSARFLDFVPYLRNCRATIDLAG